MPNLFVTGTDTNVGKTVVSVLLAMRLQYSYWKPVQTGSAQDCDSDFVRSWIGTEKVLPECIRLKAPLSPESAARLEGRSLALNEISLPTSAPLIIEGAGGLLVPLSQNTYIIDLIARLQAPAVLVTHTELGTINHTLLSLQALSARNIAIAGVVMVGKLNNQNRDAIEQHGRVPVWGTVQHCDQFSETWFRDVAASLQIGNLEEPYHDR